MRTICLDFDGVLHAYTSGWKGIAVIPDGPVAGAMEFLREASQHFKIAIYSTRSGNPVGIEAMEDAVDEWLCETFDEDTVEHIWEKITFPQTKPPAFITLDDRAMTFNGRWPSMEVLESFETWQERAKRLEGEVPF